jgi:predicted transcriptional regulator
VAPARKAVLTRKAQEEGGPSRTTISRIVDRLADTGYVVKHSGSYRLTDPGQRLLERYTDFMQTLVQALDKSEFLRWVPADLDSFPVRSLDGATFIQNTPSHPHNVLNALLQVADPGLETFEGIATIVSPTIAQAYQPLLDGNTRVTGVFPDEVLFGLHRDHEFIDYVKQQGFISYIREGIAARDAELLFVPETPPIHLAIYDGSRVIISLSPSTGVPDAEASAIDSTDPAVVAWATSFFETYRSNGRPPLRVFLDRSLGYDSSSQYQADD